MSKRIWIELDKAENFEEAKENYAKVGEDLNLAKVKE